MDADLSLAAETIGIIAFAVSGGYAAVRAGMDWVCVVVLAVVAAAGGRAPPDPLLGLPPLWSGPAPRPPIVAMAHAAVATVYPTPPPLS